MYVGGGGGVMMCLKEFRSVEKQMIGYLLAVSACERDIESLVFGRWIENARLYAPIFVFCFFVLLMHVCNSCCSNCTSCCLLCKPERCLINLES